VPLSFFLYQSSAKALNIVSVFYKSKEVSCYLYTNAQDVRDLIGLTLDDAKDEVLDPLIEKSQVVILHYIQIQVMDEQVSLDSSGFTLSLSNRYLADLNFDKAVNKDDIVVWGWTDSDDISTRSTLSLSTLWPEHGLLKLSADGSDYEKITVDYSYYTCRIDWDLLAMATSYYAAMLWVAREEFLVPEELVIGNVRVRQKQPWNKLRLEFLRIINLMTEIPMDITTYRKMVISPRSTEKYYGPGTTLDVEDSENRAG